MEKIILIENNSTVKKITKARITFRESKVYQFDISLITKKQPIYFKKLNMSIIGDALLKN